MCNMATKRHPAIDESIVRSLAEVLGHTEGGLTNREIDELLVAARTPDPTPPAPTSRSPSATASTTPLSRSSDATGAATPSWHS